MSDQLVISIRKRLLMTDCFNSLVIPVTSGRRVVLLGPSGSGKTTLLRCLAGLETPDTGVIWFRDQCWFDRLRKINWSPQRRGIGYVAQEYPLFPHLTIEKNILYGIKNVPSREAYQRVFGFLERMGLNGLERRYPHELSGGQRQRVALARALAASPCVLFLDEPFSALDAMTKIHLRGLLRDILSDSGVPALMVSHDLNDLWALADQVIVMDQGRIYQVGEFREVYRRPDSVAAARILGVDNLWEGTVKAFKDERVWVEIAGQLIECRTRFPLKERLKVRIGVRSEELRLNQAVAPHPLKGRITWIHQEAEMMRLQIDCGFPVKISTLAREFFGRSLSGGDEVRISIPPEAVLLYLSDE